jgi:hypothetical protein
VNSTSIARFHRCLPHHLHEEHQQKERKGTEIINCVAIIFIVPEAVTTGCAQKLQYRCLHPSQLPERERKKTQKTGQRRRKEGRKRRKNEKEKRNHKPVGTAFRSLLLFFAYKICRIRKKKVQKTSRERERERNEDCRGETQKKNANRE